MKRLWYRYILAGAVVLLGSTALVSKGGVPWVGAAQRTSSTPSLVLQTTADRTVAINPSQKTILHFMVSFCTSCLPTERMLTQFAGTTGVKIISVDIDPQNDSAAMVARFAEVAGAHWPHVLATGTRLINQFHVTELDTVVVLYHNQVIFDQVAPTATQLRQVLA